MVTGWGQGAGGLQGWDGTLALPLTVWPQASELSLSPLLPSFLIYRMETTTASISTSWHFYES